MGLRGHSEVCPQVPMAKRSVGKWGREGLADDAADRLQGRELFVLPDVQSLMGVEVFGGKHLSASGADLTVQLGRRVCVSRGSGHLPGALLVLGFLPSSSSSGPGLLLQSLGVSVGCQKLLLLARVWKEHQQLVEDAVEVFSQQVLTAAVVLDRRNQTLSELSRVVFELVEL